MSRSTRAAVFVLLLVAAGAAPGQDEAKPVLYHPTRFGAAWVYQVRTGDEVKEFAEAVSEVSREGSGWLVTVVEVHPDGTTFRTRKVMVTAKGLDLVEWMLWGFEPPLPQVRLPAKVGDQWVVNSERLTRLYRGVRVVEGVEQVEVPAGKFTAVRVAWDQPPEDGVGPPARQTSWFAPEVGVVKSELGTWTKVLKSFTAVK